MTQAPISTKFRQVSAVIKKYRPVTINGIPTKDIIAQVKANEAANPDHYNQDDGDAGRPLYAVKYIGEFIRMNPDASIYLLIMMKPLDPEFPFNLDKLKFSLTIPANFPLSHAKIVVINDEIPRGIAVNVEEGFLKISARKISLIAQISKLDDELEMLLAQEEKPTIEFVKLETDRLSMVTPRPSSPKPTPNPAPSKTGPKQKTPPPAPDATPESLKQRTSEVALFNAKLSPTLYKGGKDSKYKLRVPVPRNQVPELWKNGVEIIVTVPDSYPLVPLAIQVANNFTTNAIVKKKKDEMTPEQLVQITNVYRGYEKNLRANLKEVLGTIVGVVNQVANNFDKYMMGTKEFGEWREMVKLVGVN